MINLITQINKWASKNNVWYIRLYIDVPEKCLDESKALYENNYFSPHRTGWAKGWLSCMLHNWDEYKNNALPTDPNAKYTFTEIAEMTPVTTDFLKNIFPSHSYGGCSFMCLEPGGYLNPHHDSEVIRFTNVNIAFNQPDNCYVRRVDTKEEIPFTQGSSFLFNTSYEHEARNNSKELRFHFLLHPAMDNKELSELYLASIKKDYGADAIKEILQS